MKNIEIYGDKDVLIDWHYPEIYVKDKQNYLQISLLHTRGSDDIRIKYDSDRDGWIIEQPVVDKEGNNKGWRESAFCEAWKFDDEEM